MNDESQAVIDVRQLSFRYAVDEFHLYIEKLEISKGQKVALLGTSGRGKSTLLNLIAGILSPQSGKISIDGNELSNLKDAQRRDLRIAKIGYVFQDLELIDYLTTLENIILPYRINDSLNLDNSVMERAQYLAHLGGISDKLEQNITHLSRGERQRAVVCRALLPKPQLLLADEPTGSLDPDNQTHVLDMLCQHSAEHCATLLMVTHDHTHLGRFDRTIDLDDLAKRHMDEE